jgi:hypothetical protein
MNYGKPAIEVVGNAPELVLSMDKNLPSVPDSYPSTQVHSAVAYEADE